MNDSTVTGKELCNAEAVRRVNEARRLVEDAQNLLERASQLTGGVTNGGAIANDRIWKERQRCHALWCWLTYKFIEARGKRLGLDGGNAQAFLDRTQGGAK